MINLPVIFSGTSVKALKNSIILGTQATVFSGTSDPTVSATSGTIGDIYIRTGTPNIYQKITTSASDTNWKIISIAENTTDIPDTTFSAANNQITAADVTGLSFSNTTVRAAHILLSIYVNATTPLYEMFNLNIIQKGASWDIAATAVGDISGFVFSITSAGQIQYTSGNSAGFVSATIHFRAYTLSV